MRAARVRAAVAVAMFLISLGAALGQSSTGTAGRAETTNTTAPTQSQPVFPTFVKDVLTALAAALGALISAGVLLRGYIKNRAIEALKTDEAADRIVLLLDSSKVQGKIVEALNSEPGRKRLGELIALPQVWAGFSGSLVKELDTDPAKAAIASAVPPTMLERPEIRQALASALTSDPCRDAVGEALASETARQKIAEALVGQPAEERLVLFVSSPAGKQAILTMMEAYDVTSKVIGAIQSERERFLMLLEGNDIRERILKWLDTTEGRAFFESLFERDRMRTAVVKAVLAGFYQEPQSESLRKLKGMLDDPSLGGSFEEKIARAYERLRATEQRRNE